MSTASIATTQTLQEFFDEAAHVDTRFADGG